MFDISLRNIGPIASADIHVRPLTIFIGPNNAGKSYAAVIAFLLSRLLTDHAGGFYRSLPAADQVRWLVRRRLNPFEPIDLPDKPAAFKSLPKGFRDAAGETAKRLEQRIGQLLSSEVEQLFTKSVKELVTINSRSAGQIGVKSQDGLFSMQCTVDRRANNIAVSGFNVALERTTVQVPTPNELVFFTSPAEAAVAKAIQQCVTSLSRRAYYLPAARSGLLQSHRLLTQLLLRRASQVGIEPLSVPPLPGIVSEFVSTLLRLRPRSRSQKLAIAADAMAESLARGQIDLQPTESGEHFHEIMFQTGGGSFRIEDVSSSVAELAPLVLFTRHLFQPDDVVIIEEPEAHLHPENQRLMARAIADLVRNGVWVIITTHSDYLLSQFSNIVRLGSLSGKKQQKFASAATLAPEDVSVLHFQQIGKQRTTKTSEIVVDSVEGIDDREFAAVAQSLYNESAEIDLAQESQKEADAAEARVDRNARPKDVAERRRQ